MTLPHPARGGLSRPRPYFILTREETSGALDNDIKQAFKTQARFKQPYKSATGPG
jgi:hypothetical protein